MSFIRKKHLDLYLVETLEKISRTFEENFEYIKNPRDEAEREIKDYYGTSIEKIDALRGKIRRVDDLELLDEDEIDFVYECLAFFEEGFTISHRDAKIRREEERNYRKLERLLDLFC